jgi:O-antigen/teichoic acid export membrane protein
MTKSSSKTVPSTPNVAGNASFAMFAKAFYLVSRLCLPPLVLSHISMSDYGLWSASFILIMYVGLTDVGFSNVYVRYSARYHAQGDTNSINRLLSTGVITLSLLSALVLTGLWILLPHVLDFLNVDAAQRGMAKVLVIGTASMFLLDLSLGAYCYLLHGLQRIREEQKVAVIGYILELVLIFIFLQMGVGVYALLAAFVLRYLWSLTSFIRLAHRFLPGLRISFRHFDKQKLQLFFGFGAAVQASALVGTALFSLDRVLAGFMLGPKGIALFELGAKLPVAAISVPSTISNVTMPAASRHSTYGNDQAIQKLYTSASRAISMISGFPLGFMAVFAAPIAHAWLGVRDELQMLSLIMALTAIWSHLHIITGPGSSVFRALGQVGNEFVYHALRVTFLALGIGLAVAINGYTSTALILGLSGGSLIAALAYMIFNQNKLGLPTISVLRELLLPGLPGYPLAFVLLMTWHQLVSPTLGRWQTIAFLGMFGLLYCCLLALILWRWVLTHAEREHIADRIRPLISRGWAERIA